MDRATSTNAVLLQAVTISVNIAGSSKKLSRPMQESTVNCVIKYNTRTNKCYFKLTSKLTGKQKRKSGQMTHLYFCTSRCSSRLQLRETKGSAHNLSTRSEELETRQRIPVFHTNHEVRIRFQAFSKLCQAKITKQNQDFHSKTH